MRRLAALAWPVGEAHARSAMSDALLPPDPGAPVDPAATLGVPPVSSPFVPPVLPQGERLTHPAARALVAAIEACDLDVQLAAFDHLRRRFLVADLSAQRKDDREAAAVIALRACHEALAADDPEVRVTERAYRGWLATLGPGHGHPAASTLRTWLGGDWNTALRRALLAEVPDGDLVHRTRLDSYSAEGIVAAAREFLAETGHAVPTQTAFFAWARRPDVRAREGLARPQSIAPVKRLFGDWEGLLRALGLAIDADGRPLAPYTDRELRALGGGGRRQPRGARRYTRDEIRAGLRVVANRLRVQTFTGDEYETAREAIFIEDADRSLPTRRMATRTTVFREYGSWDAALIDAGLQARDGRHAKTNNGNWKGSTARYSDEVVLSAIREGYAAVGLPFTKARFEEWRDKLLAAHPERRWQRPIPRHDCVWKRFGSWRAACDLALNQPAADATTGAASNGDGVEGSTTDEPGRGR